MAPVAQLTVNIDNQTDYDLQVNSNPESYAVANGTLCITPPIDAKANTIVTAGVYKSNGISGDGVEGVAAYLAPNNIACLAIWFRVFNNQASPNAAKVANVEPTTPVDLALITTIKTHDFKSPAKFPFKDTTSGANVTLLATVDITLGGISTATVTITKV